MTERTPTRASDLRTPMRTIEAEESIVRRRSQAAADAAQHVIDIEAALLRANADRDDALNRVTLIEQMNVVLNEKVAFLEDRCDRLSTENGEIMTTVRNAAGLILGLMRKPAVKEDGPSAYAPGEASRLSALAAEIGRGQVAGEPMPRLVDAPRQEPT